MPCVPLCTFLGSETVAAMLCLLVSTNYLARVQVYERDAICNHLRRSCSDPVTRQELPGLSLTPIYLLRSRATDYREQTCAQPVCSRATQPFDPTLSIATSAEMSPPDASSIDMHSVMSTWVPNALSPPHAGSVLLQSAGVLGDRVLTVLRRPGGVRAARRGAVRLAAGAGAGTQPGMRRIRAVAPFQRLR